MILDVGNLDGIFILIFLIMFGPALLFILIGSILFAKKKKKAGKVFMILAGVYLLISIGYCGILMSS
ncbi:hypothetical protein Q2T41_09450 [Maribacter confluentis]|uniref:Uncharacterized protein n=1 Tax=Maribacter confluentis TaxID=1656093 RepID=A0ABT8RQI6_9FLAO|nr:hypothetical protein [Maribacter confluentis]MDO1512878.1 hypothetical protein [Maribacter confluentis]